MSLDFHSIKSVTIKQLIDPGTRCGIEIIKNTKHPNTYTMTWDVDDYTDWLANIAASLLNGADEERPEIIFH